PLLNATPGILDELGGVAAGQRCGVNQFVVERRADFGGIDRDFYVLARNYRDFGGFSADLEVNVRNRAAVALVQGDAVHFPGREAFGGNRYCVGAGRQSRDREEPGT